MIWENAGARGEAGCTYLNLDFGRGFEVIAPDRVPLLA